MIVQYIRWQGSGTRSACDACISISGWLSSVRGGAPKMRLGARGEGQKPLTHRASLQSRCLKLAPCTFLPSALHTGALPARRGALLSSAVLSLSGSKPDFRWIARILAIGPSGAGYTYV